MTERRPFERDLLRYGADLARWPDAERRDAEALLARDEEAGRARAELARVTAIYREATRADGMAAIDAAAIVVRARRAGAASAGRGPLIGLLPLAGMISAGAFAGAAASVAVFALGDRHPLVELIRISLTGGLT